MLTIAKMAMPSDATKPVKGLLSACEAFLNGKTTRAHLKKIRFNVCVDGPHGASLNAVIAIDAAIDAIVEKDVYIFVIHEHLSGFTDTIRAHYPKIRIAGVLNTRKTEKN